MFRSDEYKFYFTHIPKTGGTSIKKALLPYANPGQLTFNGEKVNDGVGFHPHVKLTRARAIQYSTYFKFSIVRNPWARHASLWKFLTGRGRRSVAGLSFPQYIEAVCNGNHHYSINQVDFGLKYMSFVGKFENLEGAFRQICQRTGVPENTLEHFKDQGDYSYRTMYNHKTRMLIEKHCSEDILQFEYEF